MVQPNWANRTISTGHSSEESPGTEWYLTNPVELKLLIKKSGIDDLLHLASQPEQDTSE